MKCANCGVDGTELRYGLMSTTNKAICADRRSCLERAATLKSPDTPPARPGCMWKRCPQFADVYRTSRYGTDRLDRGGPSIEVALDTKNGAYLCRAHELEGLKRNLWVLGNVPLWVHIPRADGPEAPAEESKVESKVDEKAKAEKVVEKLVWSGEHGATVARIVCVAGNLFIERRRTDRMGQPAWTDWDLNTGERCDILERALAELAKGMP